VLTAARLMRAAATDNGSPLARRAWMERHANGEAQFSICVRRAKRAREAAEKKQVIDPAEIASIRAAADLRLAAGPSHGPVRRPCLSNAWGSMLAMAFDFRSPSRYDRRV